MRISKILCAIDFSKTSDAALEYASSLARDRGGSLLLLHVEPPIAAYGDIPFYELQEPTIAEYKRRLDALAMHLGLPTTTRAVIGNPAKQILAQASDEQVDLIVMGTHGRTGLAHVIMGSTAEYVVRHAACPVLTVKSTAEAMAAT